MNIALIGYGAMGRLVHKLAEERGHSICACLDEGDAALSVEELADKLSGADAAIDFSAAGAVRRNVEACLTARVPLVVGTTGWNDQRDEITHLVTDRNGSLVYGANFSIGVNLFYRIVDHAAELFAKFAEYETFIEEQHHSRKKDAPSGTALKIEEIVKKHVELAGISSTRAGSIPGTHRVGFDGPADQILLEHTARSRDGFARGAVVAAEWIVGRTGCFEFTEVMDGIMDL